MQERYLSYWRNSAEILKEKEGNRTINLDTDQFVGVGKDVEGIQILKTFCSVGFFPEREVR